jgi:hypothetical protein
VIKLNFSGNSRGTGSLKKERVGRKFCMVIKPVIRAEKTAAGGLGNTLYCTLIKKKIKFSSYIRKFRMEQLQSHMKGFLIYEKMFKYLTIYEEAVSHI